VSNIRTAPCQCAVAAAVPCCCFALLYSTASASAAAAAASTAAAAAAAAAHVAAAVAAGAADLQSKCKLDKANKKGAKGDECNDGLTCCNDSLVSIARN